MTKLVHYLILMGIPLLGVVIVLQLGSSLKAPVSVAGDWHLVISGDASCYLARALSEANVLRIAQSGPELRLRLSAQPPINLAARLDGLVLRAGNTPDETILELNAVISTESEPDRLEGEISANRCAAPLFFSATRMPETETLLQSH